MRKDEMLKLIGNNLRRWRLEKGYGLEELARLVGISPKTLNRYETGGINMPIGRILKICQILGITVESITGGVEHGEANEREANSKVNC